MRSWYDGLRFTTDSPYSFFFVILAKKMIPPSTNMPSTNPSMKGRVVFGSVGSVGSSVKSVGSEMMIGGGGVSGFGGVITISPLNPAISSVARLSIFVREQELAVR